MHILQRFCRAEFIAVAPYRIQRPCFMVFYFFADAFDMYVDRPGVPDVIVAPDMVEELFAREHLIGS